MPITMDTRTEEIDDMVAKRTSERYAAGEQDFHTADLVGHICIK